MWLKRHKLYTKFKYSEDPIVSWKTQTHKSHNKDSTIWSEIQGCPDSKALHKRHQQATAYLDTKHTQDNPLLLGRTRHRSIPWLPEKTWVHLFAFVRQKNILFVWFFSNWLAKNMVLFFPSKPFSRYEYCSIFRYPRNDRFLFPFVSSKIVTICLRGATEPTTTAAA